MNAKGLAASDLHGHHAKNASIEGKVTGDNIACHGAFWRCYLSEHAQPATRGAWHYLGTTPALLSFIALVATGGLWFLAVMPVAGYEPAWIGHFFVEANRPAPFLVADQRFSPLCELAQRSARRGTGEGGAAASRFAAAGAARGGLGARLRYRSGFLHY